MTTLHIVIRSLAYHARMHVAVALGVAAATAVLTGALLVGDSVRGSLRDLALDRLERIDAALVASHFFRAALADDLAADERLHGHFSIMEPAILLQATVDNPDGPTRRRATGVTVLGCQPSFWRLGEVGPDQPPQFGEIVLNATLAERLHVAVGDEVLLRLPQVGGVPADSPLGRKTDTIRSRRLRVSAIIEAKGLGRFDLRPSQHESANAFVALQTVQSMLDQPGKVNALLIGSDRGETPTNPAEEAALAEAVQDTAQIEDFDLRLQLSPRGYIQLTSQRMLLPPAAEEAALAAWDGLRPQTVLTYLANYILADDGRGKIPYSTISALELATEPPLGPLLDLRGDAIPAIADGEILLNQWAVDDLAAQGVQVNKGDPIKITYFEPESTHGQVREAQATLRLAGVVQLVGAAADADFTPEVKGVTDEDSIADWDPPFPYDPQRVRSVPPNDQDDAYWQQHRATPKGFVSLATGRKLWGSRFGQSTSVRVGLSDERPAESLTDRLTEALRARHAALGLEFTPLKRHALEAAQGTTPFNALFLGFSMFLIASAVMLVALLYKLGVELRATEIGVLLAVGFRRAKIRGLLAAEGLVVAAAGAIMGMVGGAGYAWLMLVGLRTWWVEAIVTPFLELHVTAQSLAIGVLAGLAVALATIGLSLRQVRRVSARRLLAGQFSEPPAVEQQPVGWARLAAAVALLGAVGVAAVALPLGGEAQAAAFFACGALVLVGLLAATWSALCRDRKAALAAGAHPLVRLATRNGARHPLRSTLTIGLVAAACFLIVAISAFRLEPSAELKDRQAGHGGFALVASSDQPIYHDLNASASRTELGFDDEANEALSPATIVPLRVQQGDDASCLNLYQSRQPRVLGVTPGLIQRGGFAWGATAAQTAEQRANPWLLLEQAQADPPTGPRPIPVVIDHNTAVYSLHLRGKPGEVFEIDHPRGGKLRLEVVGLLKNSIFQGDLLISEQHFLREFPDASGYRLFLVDAPEDRSDQIAQTLEVNLGDYGLAVQSSRQRLAGFLAVQNTYLSTFQSLGGLGLLLGTLGLGVVQLRGVLERRGELALMQAAGFRRRRLAELVLLENATLLVAGLATGILAAIVAVMPHLLAGGAGIPWPSLAVTLALVVAAGLLASAAAVRATLDAPLLPALRGE
jgi:putative ABC transport system permease protein